MSRSLKWLMLGVIAYVVLACSWWSVLLYTKNQDAYQAKMELQAIGMAAEGLISSPSQYKQTKQYKELEFEYKRQEIMIISEAIVLLIGVCIGLWFVNRLILKEIAQNRLQKNFLLSITHELKSPIAASKLIFETILRRRLSQEQIQQFSSDGIRSSDRLLTLVNNILMAAKLESSYAYNMDSVNFTRLVGEQIDAIESKYPDVILERSLEKTRDIKGDQTALVSVILNLIENAIKYTPIDNPLSVSVEQLDESICFQVADLGPGIPDEEKKQIFAKFYRIGNEDTRRTKGTGLGLFIVNEIVSAHKGSIQIKNNTPHGTVFQVSFPN